MSSNEILSPNSEAVQSVRMLVLYIAKALVDHSEAVEVETVPDDRGISLCLKVASDDLGKVIGKQGRTARSIRTILAAASTKLQIRLSLDIQPSLDRR